jgi:hypothetical protein
MPAEWFRLTIGGVAGLTRNVSLTDPLSGRAVPARIVSRHAGKLVVALPLTDSPRLLVLSGGRPG